MSKFHKKGIIFIIEKAHIVSLQVLICSSISYQKPHVQHRLRCGHGAFLFYTLCVRWGNSPTLQRHFVVNFLALFDDYALVQCFDGQGRFRVGDFLTIHQHTSLLDQLAGFTVGAAQPGSDHRGQ